METRPSGELAAGVATPPDIVEEPPRFDTSSLEVPQPTLDAPGGLGELPEIADEVEIEVTGPGQGDSGGGVVAPGPELGQPEAPAPAPERATEAPKAPRPASHWPKRNLNQRYRYLSSARPRQPLRPKRAQHLLS